MPAVSNSTPLIILSKIGKLDILKEYFKAVYIPQAVYLEVVLQGKGLKGSKEVDDAEWINVENINNRLAARTLSIHLGAGEAEAIILAEEKEMLLLIVTVTEEKLQKKWTSKSQVQRESYLKLDLMANLTSKKQSYSLRMLVSG
jgi:predicted nucleic acid-binding protein